MAKITYHENADAKRAMRMTQQERCPYCGLLLQLGRNVAVERAAAGKVVGAYCVDCYVTARVKRSRKGD